MRHTDLISGPWEDYELIDSGDNRKLERFGKYILIRPETQAIWKPERPEKWKQANAEFRFSEGKGSWKKNGIPDTWPMTWEEARFSVKLTSFKHTGIFPEQAVNWEWLRGRTRELRQPKVLNLFGYTGIASIVVAKSGARVTHVDASKQSNVWVKENARLSGVSEEAIRYILDDALKFVEREGRRGAVYDGVILDPPAFGRGAKGEVWKIEEDFPKLLEGLSRLLSKKPGAFFLLNGYAAGYSPQSFLQAIQSFFPDVDGEFGELHIGEKNSKRCVPSGIYVRFARG
jgi:23S rRNA (cytosine1962-C5)-methyltransferase